MWDTRRGLQLGLIGAAVAGLGVYEAVSHPLGWRSVTQHGERYPELAGALVGALVAHFAASIVRSIIQDATTA